MNELTNIRWMAFYQGATQEEFNGFIEHHPELEVVDIIKNESISDLHPLLTLKNIYGLTVADSLTDFQTLKSLKSLAFLSLPDVVLNDSIKKAELQKSLPDTKLVATHGVCLGSGWLLLIIPFVLLFRTIRMRTLPVRNRS